MSAADRPPSPSWAMGGITNRKVEEYLNSLLPARDPVLAEIEAEATRRKIPIVGPLVGRLLYQLARIAGAKTVFEMGSAVGYSTIWWALAVGEGGRVIYTDGSSKNAEEARRYFARIGLTSRIQVMVGDAIELLSEQKSEFDIIFNDIDKEDYPRALRVALPRLRSGGLFVCDNVLWSGTVAGVTPATEKSQESIRGVAELNRALYASQQLWTTILPLRDGVAVAVKG